MAVRRNRIEASTGIAIGSALTVVLVSVLTVACGSSNAATDEARGMVEGQPLKVEAEQVILAPGEVDCGVRAELWSAPTQPNAGKAFCPLLPAGRALHFDDDVVYTEPGYSSSYVQVRGTFSLAVLDNLNVKEGPEKNTKLVEAKTGVKIDNACFPNPLPLMGVRKGQFTQDRPPAMLFRMDGTWQLDKFVH